MNRRFKDKIVIITGSSQGIGKALAELMGQYNAKIVINARNAEKVNQAVNVLTQKGITAEAFIGDITDAAVAADLIAFTIRKFGRIDILVNNAGVSMRGVIDTLSYEVIQQTYYINTIAPYNLTRLALPYLKESAGSVVFISSLAGLRGLPVISVYSSAKMALTALAQSLRVEYGSYGIHVGIVYVGITKIEEGKTAIGHDGKPVVLDKREGRFKDTPEKVADKIAQNIYYRKKKSVIGIPGKIFFFLSRVTPGLLEWLVTRSHKKMGKLYK